MQVLEFARLARNHVRNALAEGIYLRGGRDFTRPIEIHGIINEVCNYRCRYCECWRQDYLPEMTIAEWRKALLDLKAFVGDYHIEFSGGEPYLKKGFLDLLQFCHSEGIRWGVTTNGSSFLSDRVVRETIAARPFNINVSIDSKRAGVHDYSRGVEGSLQRLLSGLTKVASVRNERRLSFPIIIKAVVHRLNFRYLPEMAHWAQEIGATVINFQPVNRWSPETRGELWIDDPQELEELREVRDRLVAMKRAGAPILNSELILNAWDKHFLAQKAPDEYRPCRVGMRNYLIRPNGEVEVCWYYPSIGNVRRNNARDIWRGDEANRRRRETVACDSLCLFTCLSQKSLADKVKMGLMLLAGRFSGRAARTAGGPIS